MWALLLSTILHFVFGPLLAALIFFRLLPNPNQVPIEREVVTSSAIRIERRARPQRLVRPQPRRVAFRRIAAKVPPAIHVIHVNHVNHVAHVKAPRTEQPRTLTPQAIAQQEQRFARTIAQTRKVDDPVLGAARATQPPVSIRHYRINFAGAAGTPSVEVYGEPIKSWREGDWDYYYIRYSALFGDGSVENGVIPWPERYPNGDDPFAEHRDHFPVRGPLPGYVLPPGTQLTRFLQMVYQLTPR
jgi:hypothetical protein